jgi:Phosphotransferase enzyme family
MLDRWPVGPGAVVARAGQGHINDSWLVDPAPGDGPGPLLLQRLNPRVFPDGGRVMQNVGLVVRHLDAAVHRLGLEQPHRHALRLVTASDGTVAQQAPDGAWWRLVHRIERVRPGEPVRSVGDAREVGLAFGRFASMLSDLDPRTLVETLPGFHDTAARLAALRRAAADDPASRSAAVAPEIERILERSGYAGVVPPLVASGALPVRVVHNDAKAANVLLDSRSGTALAVVDLDTVMPGTLLHDLGDLLRSVATDAAEDEADPARIRVRPDRVEAVTRGYFEAALRLLTETERNHFIFAGILLSYEQAVRFLTDYLTGDVYYRTSRPSHNLDRARAQLGLVLELERHRAPLEALVADLARSFA